MMRKKKKTIDLGGKC